MGNQRTVALALKCSRSSRCSGSQRYKWHLHARSRSFHCSHSHLSSSSSRKQRVILLASKLGSHKRSCNSSCKLGSHGSSSFEKARRCKRHPLYSEGAAPIA